MKITFITSGGDGGGSDTNTWRTVTAGGQTLTGAPSGEALAFTEGTGITITESGGEVTITNNNPTDTNTWRPVTAGGNTLGAAETLAFTAGTGISITESAGAVTLTNDNPTDTNTNWATNSLQASSATRYMRVAASGSLSFQANSGVTAMKITDSGAAVQIGATPYTMPTTRASAANEVLISTDGSGSLEFDSLSGVGGFCMMMSGYAGSTWASDNYGFMRKDGGNMFIDTNLTVSASGAQQIHMFNWNSRLKPNAYKIVGQRVSSGAIGGVSCHVYYNTPNNLASNILWTQGTELFNSFLSDASSFWESGSGVIDASSVFDGVSDGDFVTFAFTPEDDVADGRLWLTLYFDNTVS